MLVIGGELAFQQAAKAEADLPTFSEHHVVGTVRIVAQPAIGTWSRIGEGYHWESDGGYLLALNRADQPSSGRWTLELSRKDGGQFKVDQLGWELAVPLGKVASVFDTQAHSASSIVRRAPAIDAALDVRPNQGVPYQAAIDHYGRNTLALGSMDVTGTYRITGQRQDDNYRISLVRNEYQGDRWFSGNRLEDSVFVSADATPWFDTARAYADLVDEKLNYEPLSPPEHADLPYYSTWYAFRDHIDQETIRTQAKLAKELGCGVFQIFIGWSTCEDWFDSGNSWGDYTPCKERFSDLKGLIAELQNELGLAVQIWTAPTWIGEKSEAYQQMAKFRSKWPGGDYSRNLDPRSPEAREHIRKQFTKLASELGVDGYYVDFADTLYNRNDATHRMEPRHFGAAFEEFVAAMHAGFSSQHSAPLAEYRQPFANQLTKKYATLFTTTYTDGDWEKNYRIAIIQRPFSAGVITRSDPLVFTSEQLDNRDETGKAFSATLLCGVPGLSMDLTKLSAAERERVAAWLSFYKEHRRVLTRGELRPFGSEYHLPEVMVTHGETAFARVSRWETSQIPFPEGTKHAFIFVALPEEVSFIARLDPRRWSGLAAGKYQCRWVDSSLESHEGWFNMTLPVTGNKKSTLGDTTHDSLKTPREIWDFDHQEEGIPSLDVKRGGFLELVWTEE